MQKSRPFYEGENIDLIVPTVEHARESSWPDWFNDQHTTRYTHHGIFPNSVEDQVEFVQGLRASGRIALLITAKGRETPVGTVSLSSVDMRNRTAAIAIVMDTKTAETVHPQAALEAISLMTEHAFNVLGLRRIDSGQAYPALARWNQMLEILGYRTEGIRRNAFARGHVISDDVIMACLHENFSALVDQRGGRLWPGSKAAIELIRSLPAQSFAARLDEAYRALEAEYFGG